MLVFEFLTLLLMMLGATFRQTAAVLRVEAARSNQFVRDQGSLVVAAKALTMLESGPPPTAPYQVTLGVSTSVGMRSYQVAFSSDPSGSGN